MPPVRTAIIGLSANGISNWASHAHLPHLLSAAGKSRFEIVALCNSSVESARAAIKAFNLPAGTRAYGSPEDLAGDKDVQFVVVSTRVDKHYETAWPSVAAGKDVYVEWPLADNTARAGELVELAREKGGRTVVGLQAWFSPVLNKVKELIAGDRIGKILSSEVHASGGGKDRVRLSNGLEYFTDKKIGGNVVTIGFGHLSDGVQSVLGEVQNVQSQLQIQRPEVKLIDPSSGKITGTVNSDVPDLIYVVGLLPKSGNTAKGASISLRFRRGQAFKGEPALLWTINGERGEIRISSDSGPSAINANSDDAIIKVHDFETDEVEKVEWDEGSYGQLPPLARNIAAVYDAYADGDASGYADFDHAWKRHKQLDTILAGF